MKNTGLTHAPNKDLTACQDCGLAKDSWAFHPYCLAKTTHSEVYRETDFDKLVGPRKDHVSDPTPKCASCGLPEDCWTFKPDCPTSRWNPDWKPIRLPY